MFLSSSGDLKISSALLIGRSYQLTSFLMASCSFYIVLVLNVYEVLSTALFLEKKISKLSSDVTHSLSKDVSSCTCVEPRVICRSILRNIFTPLRLRWITLCVFPKYFSDLNFEAVRVARVGVCLDYHFFTACIIFHICKILYLVSYGILYGLALYCIIL